MFSHGKSPPQKKILPRLAHFCHKNARLSRIARLSSRFASLSRTAWRHRGSNPRRLTPRACASFDVFVYRLKIPFEIMVSERCVNERWNLSRDKEVK